MRNAGTKGISIKSWPDAWSGAFFAVLGGSASIYSMLAYRLGTPASMGPGFFPALVGAVICLLGVMIFVFSIGVPASEPKNAEGERIGYIFATLAVVTVAILGFALLLRPIGLVPSVFVLVLLSRLVRRGSLLELLVLGAVLSAIAYLIFVVGLAMPMRVGPW